MAMSTSSLADAIVSNLQGKGLAAEDTGPLSKWANAIADAIITEISNAEITIATGIIQVQGSPTAQANVAPIMIPAGSIA